MSSTAKRVTKNSNNNTPNKRNKDASNELSRFQNFEHKLAQLDEEYHALDLVSETLITSLGRLQKEENILRKALGQVTTNSSTKRPLYQTLQKSNKQTKSDLIMERLESVLFDTDDEDEESNHLNIEATLAGGNDRHAGILETKSPSEREESRHALHPERKGNQNERSYKNSPSSDSEIDEDELLRL